MILCMNLFIIIPIIIKHRRQELILLFLLYFVILINNFGDNFLVIVKIMFIFISLNKIYFSNL